MAGTEQRPSHHTYDGSDEPGVLSAGAIRPFRDEVSITLDCRSTCTNNSYRLASPSWADIKILRRRLSQRFTYSNERRMVLPEATRKLVHFAVTIAGSRLRLLQPRGLTAWSLITVIKNWQEIRKVTVSGTLARQAAITHIGPIAAITSKSEISPRHSSSSVPVLP